MVPGATVLTLTNHSEKRVKVGYLRFALLLLVASALPGGSAFPQGSWSAAVNGGYATGVDNDFTHGSFAVTGSVLRQVGRTLGVGAEVGYQQYERQSELVELGTLEYRSSAWHAGGLLRVRSPTGRVRPYGAAGIALYGLARTDNGLEGAGFLSLMLSLVYN